MAISVFLHGYVNMFWGLWFQKNGICFVSLYYHKCCFCIFTDNGNFIVIIICISIIIVIIIIELVLFVLTLFNVNVNVIVAVSLLPIFIMKVESCTTCTLNDLVPCSKGIESYDFQSEICTKKYCELIKAVAEIFSL